MASRSSWWASKVRQFRSHVRARVGPDERAALADWLTPAQLALFDAMHVADRRHGLDVVATLRADGSATTRTCSSPGCSTTPARAGPGCGRGSRTRWASSTDAWVWRAAGVLPGWRLALDRLRDHAETSAALAGTAGLLGTDRRADPAPGRPGRRGRRAGACCSPTRRTDAADGNGSPGVPVMAGAAAVRFGDGRRPEAATHVQVAEFDGPLALLLSLIEARQLDVLTVPLGELADAYLEALADLEADRLGNVSSFVAVASQLILIKSRAMLPRPPAVEPDRRWRRRPRPRGRAARPVAALSRPPRRRPAPRRRRARADRPVPPRARRRPGGRPVRGPAERRSAARPGPPRRGAGAPRDDRAATASRHRRSCRARSR